jgi:hypothetical protein
MEAIQIQITRGAPLRAFVASVGLLIGPTFVITDTSAQRAAILRDVKTIQVDATVVAKPDKVKEDFGPNLVQDALRNALRISNFEISESAQVKAHIVLEEFSSGNAATRFIVGFGAGEALSRDDWFSRTPTARNSPTCRSVSAANCSTAPIRARTTSATKQPPTLIGSC